MIGSLRRLSSVGVEVQSYIIKWNQIFLFEGFALSWTVYFIGFSNPSDMTSGWFQLQWVHSTVEFFVAFVCKQVANWIVKKYIQGCSTKASHWILLPHRSPDEPGQGWELTFGGVFINNISPTTWWILSRLITDSSCVMWDLASTLSPPQYPWRWEVFRRKTVWSKISN